MGMQPRVRQGHNGWRYPTLPPRCHHYATCLSDENAAYSNAQQCFRVIPSCNSDQTYARGCGSGAQCRVQIAQMEQCIWKSRQSPEKTAHLREFDVRESA